MKKNIVKYGLYGEDEKALIPDFVHCETIETRSRAHDWEIKPHIHLNLFQIFLFEKGEGVIIGEKEDTTLQTPCIVVMPANNLHGFRYTTETNGRVITISDSFLESLFKTSPKVNMELNKMRHIHIENEIARFESLIRIIDRISQELYEDLPEKRLAMQAYLSILLVEVFRFVYQRQERLFKTDNRQLTYFQAFQKNIKKALSASKTVTEYAKELNITTVHLNRICQAVAQKSALQVAHEHIISEAKKYLIHTSYTITEVCYMLHFNDPAYFSRLFKKEVGVSPKAFKVGRNSSSA
jgi:AraC family transcriptional regulator, transcriptional activator of pobA